MATGPPLGEPSLVRSGEVFLVKMSFKVFIFLIETTVCKLQSVLSGIEYYSR